MLYKIKYIFRSLIDNINKTSKKYAKSKICIILDMIICMIRYSASPANYYYFGFAQLSHTQRKTYVTHKMSEQIQKKYNLPKYHIVFYDKIIFSRVFSEFYGRKCIATETMNLAEFKNFIEVIPKFIYKPLEGGQGKGIQVFEKDQSKSYTEIYENLKGTHGIIEEWIHQHPKMQELYPKSVNIIRIQTIYTQSKCNFLCATLTIGHNNKIANASANSIFTLVDVENGHVFTNGCDYNDNIYIKHPETGIQFKDFQIPLWDEVLEMLEKASSRVPQIAYVGWDVAITENGPVIIEGNNDGGYVGYQLADLCNGHGQKELYQQYL